MDLLKTYARKIVFIAFMVSALSAAVTMAVFFKYSNTDPKKTATSAIREKLKNYAEKEPEKTSYNILLLGYGGAGHSGGGLSDALLVAHINTASKVINLITIPRDIWVELPIRSDRAEAHKINAAYAIGNDDKTYGLKEPFYIGEHGGGNMAAYAVEEISGLNIDYYAAIDFNRFERAIDALDGISVNVPVAFSDHFYPIKGLENESCGFTPEQTDALKVQYSGFELEKQYTCRYEVLTFAKGKVAMDGKTALKFIRSRHSAEHGGDFARGERQQAVLLAMRDKLLTLGALENIDEFYEEFRSLINTDMDEGAILEVLAKLGNPKDYTLKPFNITADNYLQNTVSADGQYILVPKAGANNWSQLHSAILAEIEE